MPEAQADKPLWPASDDREWRLFKAFLKFHMANPFIYKLFERFSREALQAGLKHYSARGVFDRIRWETGVVTQTDDMLKISNNHRPLYARMLMHDYPEFEGFFRLVFGGDNAHLDAWLIKDIPTPEDEWAF
jgi:hypothetical protein